VDLGGLAEMAHSAKVEVGAEASSVRAVTAPLLPAAAAIGFRPRGMGREEPEFPCLAT
jgi:hypothetical protein